MDSFLRGLGVFVAITHFIAVCVARFRSTAAPIFAPPNQKPGWEDPGRANILRNQDQAGSKDPTSKSGSIIRAIVIPTGGSPSRAKIARNSGTFWALWIVSGR